MKFITEENPDWFESNIRKELNKQELLEMARNGKKKPAMYSKDIKEKKLGKVLYNYTRKYREDYDAAFDSEIRRISTWFNRSIALGLSYGKKQELLGMAINGEEKPARKSSNGLALSRYTTKGNSYDESFTVEIKEVNPDWFPPKLNKIKKEQRKKKEQEKAENIIPILKQLVLDGKPRPGVNSSLGRFIRTKLVKLSEISWFKENAPRWFLSQMRINVNTNILLLKQKAIDGNSRPYSRSKNEKERYLSQLLTNITNTHNAQYRGKDAQWFRETRPDWFRK